MRELQGLVRFGSPGAFLLVKASRCVHSPQELTELLLADGAFTFPPSLLTLKTAFWGATLILQSIARTQPVTIISPLLRNFEPSSRSAYLCMNFRKYISRCTLASLNLALRA